MSEFCGVQIPRSIFEVDANPMGQRPGPEESEPAGGKAEPDIRQIGKVGPAVLCLLETDLRQGLRRPERGRAAETPKRTTLFELGLVGFGCKAIRSTQLAIGQD